MRDRRASRLENTTPGNGEIRSERGLSGVGFGLSDVFGGSLGSLRAKVKSRYVCARSWSSIISSIRDFATLICSLVPSNNETITKLFVIIILTVSDVLIRDYQQVPLIVILLVGSFLSVSDTLTFAPEIEVISRILSPHLPIIFPTIFCATHMSTLSNRGWFEIKLYTKSCATAQASAVPRITQN